MAPRRHRRRKKRAKTSKGRRWQQAKHYLEVTGLCLLVALLLSILAGQIPVIVERMIDNSLADIIQKTLANPGLQK